MGFNKIKCITSDNKIIQKALEESKLIEFNEDKSKLRKKNIQRYFLN
jgi:hypothetical protein